MRMKVSRTALAVAAALAAAMTLSGTPAMASPGSSSAVTANRSAVTTHGPRSAAPRASGYCNWNGGTYICNDGILGPYTFPDGQKEYWVIGTNHQVWTYWDEANGVWHWTSLGGYADTGASYVYYSGWAVTIEVIGSDHNSIYCDVRGDTQYSGWSGWKLC
jgi:hypothetical protein